METGLICRIFNKEKEPPSLETSTAVVLNRHCLGETSTTLKASIIPEMHSRQSAMYRALTFMMLERAEGYHKFPCVRSMQQL